MDLKRFCIIGVLSAGVLVGCGSDSDDTAIGANYSGSEAEGKITDTSKASFEKSAVELVSNFSIAGLAEEELPIYNFFPQPVAVELTAGTQALAYKDEVESIKELVENLGNSNSVLPVGITEEEVIEGTCDGVEGTLAISMTTSGSLDEAPLAMEAEVPAETFEMSQSLVFNNFCDAGYTDGLVWNGSVTSSMTESNSAGSLSLHIQNFSMKAIGSNESMIFSAKLESSGSGPSDYYYALDISLSANGLTAAVSISEECGEEIPNGGCQESMVFKGIDGKIHRIDDADYDYSYGQLDYLEGKLYDATHGFVYLDTGEISLCEDDAGNLQLQDSIIRLYQESPVMVDGQQVEVRMEISAGQCGVYESDIFTSEIPQ